MKMNFSNKSTKMLYLVLKSAAFTASDTTSYTFPPHCSNWHKWYTWLQLNVHRHLPKNFNKYNQMLSASLNLNSATRASLTEDLWIPETISEICGSIYITEI